MTESELIQASLNGDTSCFEQLVIAQESPLLRFLRLRCSCHSDADDLFQETFLNAHRYLASFDSKYAFSTWLFNIANNLLKNYYRQQHNIQSIAVEELHTTPSNLSQDPDQSNIWQLAKSRLDSEQLSLLWLTYVQGYTGKESAYTLQRSLPWVKINLIRAKHVLKEAINEANLELSDMLQEEASAG